MLECREGDVNRISMKKRKKSNIKESIKRKKLKKLRSKLSDEAVKDLAIKTINDIVVIDNSSKQVLLNYYMTYYHIFRQLVKDIKNEEDIISATKTMYEHLDSGVNELWQEKSKNIESSCEKGCFYCCYQMVKIFPPSAIVIRDRTGSVNDETSGLISPVGTKCVFLINKECSIYNIRPFTCRYWHSVGDPLACENYFINGKNQERKQLVIVMGFGSIVENLVKFLFEIYGYQMEMENITKMVNNIDVVKWLRK